VNAYEGKAAMAENRGYQYPETPEPTVLKLALLITSAISSNMPKFKAIAPVGVPPQTGEISLLPSGF